MTVSPSALLICKRRLVLILLGKDVIRPYTPITLIDQCGFFELLVKTYPQGVMSKHIASLMPGGELEFQGPFKKIDVTPNMKHHIGMIAGGTGK